MVVGTKQLWRGEVPLVTTFWVYGVLARAILFLIPNSVLMVRQERGMTFAGEEFVILGLLCFEFAYDTLLAVGTWRAAGKYTGWVWWSRLARLSVLWGCGAAIRGCGAAISG